jgi:hypothetical protein
LPLTSPLSSGRLVGIIRLWTKATEFGFSSVCDIIFQRQWLFNNDFQKGENIDLCLNHELHQIDARVLEG